jgi:hypothetical protein
MLFIRKKTHLVGAWIFEEYDSLLLEPKTGLLREEEVGTLNYVLEVGLAIGIEKVRNVGDVDSFGTASARDEEVGLDTEVEGVTEVGPVGDDLAGRKLHILLINQDLVTFRAELRGIELDDGLASLGEADQLGAVKPRGVIENTATINDSTGNVSELR